MVTKHIRYKGRKGESVKGYEVLWDDGERERWPYEYLVVALVSEEKDLLYSDDSDNDNDIDNDNEETESDSDTDVFDLMTEREDPEDFEYREMFSTSHTGEDIVVPGDC